MSTSQVRKLPWMTVTILSPSNLHLRNPPLWSRRSLPPTPKTPINSFTDHSSEAKDSAEEIQSLRLIPKKPSLGSLLTEPRPLPPIPETLATPFIDQSSGDEDNALGISIGTGNRDYGDDDIYTRVIDGIEPKTLSLSA